MHRGQWIPREEWWWYICISPYDLVILFDSSSIRWRRWLWLLSVWRGEKNQKLSRGNSGTLHENNYFYRKDQISCNESNGLVDQVYDQIICNKKFFKKKITDTCTLSYHINAGLPFYWHVKECIRGVTLKELTAGPQRESILWEILVRNQNLTGLTPRAGTMK